MRRSLIVATAVGVALLSLLLLPAVRGAAWLNVARLQQLQGHPDLALQSFQRALDSDPGSAYLRLQLGAALAHTGRRDAAAQALVPLVPPAIAGRSADMRLLDALNDAGRASDALQIYRAAADRKALLPTTAAGMLAVALASPAEEAALVEDLMRQVFALDPAAQSFAGFVAEIRSADFLGSAAGRRLRERLAEQSMGPPPASQAAGQPLTSTQIGAQAARVLDLDRSAVALGPPLISGDRFAQSSGAGSSPSADGSYLAPGSAFLPPGWSPTLMATCAPWNCGAFLLGPDPAQSVSGQYALRVDGLRVARAAGLEAARAGFWHPSVTVQPGQPYVIAFAYRTEQLGASEVSLWFSDEPGVFEGANQPLTASDDAWRRVTVIAWNRSAGPAAIQPMLRLWGEGSVWFDDFSIYPLELSFPVAPGSALVQFGAP